MNFVKKYEDKQLAAIQADKNIPEFSSRLLFSRLLWPFLWCVSATIIYNHTILTPPVRRMGHRLRAKVSQR